MSRTGRSCGSSRLTKHPSDYFTCYLDELTNCWSAKCLVKYVNLKLLNTRMKWPRGSPQQTPVRCVFECNVGRISTPERLLSVWRPEADRSLLTAQQRPVHPEGPRQVLDVGDPLVRGPAEVVGVVQAAQDDAGEVDGLGEISH